MRRQTKNRLLILVISFVFIVTSSCDSDSVNQTDNKLLIKPDSVRYVRDLAYFGEGLSLRESFFYKNFDDTRLTQFCDCMYEKRNDSLFFTYDACKLEISTKEIFLTIHDFKSDLIISEYDVNPGPWCWKVIPIESFISVDTSRADYWLVSNSIYGYPKSNGIEGAIRYYIGGTIKCFANRKEPVDCFSDEPG